MLLFIVAIASLLKAKCADALIHVYGDIMGEFKPGLTVTIETCPKTKRDAPDVQIKDRHFDLTTQFDTFLVRDREGDRCFRFPETVTLVLKNQESEFKRINLDIEKDFIRSERGIYELRSTVVIQLP
jgi:hypothetical protein